MPPAHDTIPTLHALVHKFQGCFRNTAGLEYRQPSHSGTQCISDWTKHTSKLFSSERAGSAMRRRRTRLLPADWTFPRRLVREPAAFLRQGDIWRRGHPCPSHPYGSAPGNNSGRRVCTGQEEIFNGLPASPAAHQVSPGTKEAGSTSARQRETLRCPGGHRGATQPPGG